MDSEPRDASGIYQNIQRSRLDIHGTPISYRIQLREESNKNQGCSTSGLAQTPVHLICRGHFVNCPQRRIGIPGLRHLATPFSVPGQSMPPDLR